MKSTIITFWLTDGLGGVVIDPSGGSEDDNIRELRQRYGNRLIRWAVA